jgi:hypothetical protein
MPCAACGELLAAGATQEDAEAPGRASQVDSARSSRYTWDEEVPSIRLVRSALPVEGVLVRDTNGVDLALASPAPHPQGTPRPVPGLSASGRPASPEAWGMPRVPQGPGFDAFGAERANGALRASDPAREAVRSDSPPPSASRPSRTARGPSGRPSPRPSSRPPSSRVAALLNLPPPGFDGPEEDVQAPVDMPADFVVKDVDGTTRAERPPSRPAPQPSRRAERRAPKPERGPAFRLSLEFWLVLLVLMLIALFFIARLYAV